MKKVFEKWNSISLVLRILCGLIIGIILGLAIPKATVIIIFGDLFVGALKAIAPLLVFFLVMSALAHMGEGQKTNMGFIVMLYMLGNLFSALVSVVACKLFPVTLTLAEAAGGDMAPPSGVGEVLKNLLLNVVSNPVGSIVNANYIGILAWACIFGIALKGASASTKKMLDDFSDAISNPEVEITLKIRPMIPNGAKLMTHLTPVEIASEKSSSIFFVDAEAPFKAIPKIQAHARIPI